jgi:hypothetical protein
MLVAHLNITHLQDNIGADGWHLGPQTYRQAPRALGLGRGGHRKENIDKAARDTCGCDTGVGAAPHILVTVLGRHDGRPAGPIATLQTGQWRSKG